MTTGFAERLVVWGMRYWVLGRRRGVAVEGLLLETFVRIDAPDAAGILDRVMRTLIRGHSRRIAIGGAGSAALSPDERLLLEVIACHQTGTGVGTDLRLCRFLDPAAAGAVDELLGKLARSLARAGLFLARPRSALYVRKRPSPGAGPLVRLQPAVRLH